MKVYEIELPVLASIRSRVKEAVHKENLEVPCRVIASIKRMYFGKQPIVYKFDFLVEEGPSRFGLVAHELEHWNEEEPTLDTRELVKDIPTDELAQILAERLKVLS